MSSRISPVPDDGLSLFWRRVFRVLLYVPAIFIHWSLNTDVWFLLNGGRYVLFHGIPHTEPFSIHQGLHFVMQQWLTGVTFYSVYHALGRIGLYLLMMAVFAAIITVLFSLCMLVSGGRFIVSFGVTMLTSVAVSLFITTRPQIFSILLILLELYVLEGFMASGRRRQLFALPLLSVLLVNLHAAMWPMLFVILLPYWVDAFAFRLGPLRGQSCRKFPLAAATAGMVAAGFLNPYGPEAMTYLFRSYGYEEISSLVNEMLSPSVNNSLGKIIFLYMLAVVLVYCLHRTGRTRIRYVLLTLGTGYLALSSVRSTLLFLVGAFFPLAYYLKNLPEPRSAAPTRKILMLRRAMVAVICAGLAVLAVNAGIGMVKDDGRPPSAGAMEYLLQNTDPKNVVLYVGYNDGDYAEYMGFRCYIDARAEVYVKKNNGKADIMKEYYDLYTGHLDMRKFLGKYPFTHLLVTKKEPLYYELPELPDYRLLYQDDYCAVYQRLK